MTDLLAAPPPPYRTDSTSSERRISDASAVTVVANSNLEGIRNSILDNAPVLFILGHHGYKPLPKDFYVVTVKAPPTPNPANLSPNRFHACLMFCDSAFKKGQETKLFVQSPQRDTMEEALAALLQKTQEMLGRRWQLPLSCARLGPTHVYLES